MPKAKANEPFQLEELQEAIPTIFDQVQQSLANHRKNCVALHKLHQRAATITKISQKKTKYVGEKAFADLFLDMVNRVLVLKKGPPAADRVVKFVGSYVEYLNAKGSDDADAEETTTSRFVARILGWLLQGFSAKNKNVRFRCLQVVSELISHIGEVEEDTYSLLREGLTERLSDKEVLIRANAAAALSKLVGSEDPDEVEAGEQSVLDILLDVLASDPAAEVRRSALLNAPLTTATIGPVLQRTRDSDTITRKIMYTAVLPKLEHPRHLTLVQREQVIKDGLGDREPGVRVAAGKLLSRWFDVMVEEGGEETLMQAFIRFLGLFDVIGSGEAIAVDAVTCIFVTRPDIPDAFVFPEDYWKQLTPESSVLARVFVEHCVKTANETRLESASLPVVTAFAFHIQEAYNQLLNVLGDMETARLVAAGAEAENEELEELLAKREVVLGELLRMALKLDYADEIGRRKIFTVVKDMLAHPQLPPGLIERCVDVLKEIMTSERDLIRLVVEIIVELRENEEMEETENMLGNLDDPDQSGITNDNLSAAVRAVRTPKDREAQREAMSPEERREADLTDIRCLMLCIAVLERVNESFEDNSTLEGILADLIIPSVKRKELAMREKALISLGLCCLIAKNMALRSFQLFLGQVENSPPELKLQVLRIILDLLIMYDQEFFKNTDGTAQQVIAFLIQTLQTEEHPKAQAVICTGICKLLLAGIISDSTVLTSLAQLYISPTTFDNQELRQCLSYFFPVYAYASYANQKRIALMFLGAYDDACRLHSELEEDQEMVAAADYALMFVDWTDPGKAAQIANTELSESQNAHVDLAVQLLSALYDSERSDEDKKVFCQTLRQLQVCSTPSKVDDKSVHKLHLLIENLESQCPFNNAPLTKLFNTRFRSKFATTFSARAEAIDAREYAEDSEVEQIYETMGLEPPIVDEAFALRMVRKKADARANAATNGDDAPGPDPNVQVLSTATDATEPPLDPQQVEDAGGDADEGGADAEPSREVSSEVVDYSEEEVHVEHPIERPVTPTSRGTLKRQHDTPGTSRNDRKKRSRTSSLRKSSASKQVDSEDELVKEEDEDVDMDMQVAAGNDSEEDVENLVAVERTPTPTPPPPPKTKKARAKSTKEKAPAKPKRRASKVEEDEADLEPAPAKEKGKKKGKAPAKEKASKKTTSAKSKVKLEEEEEEEEERQEVQPAPKAKTKSSKAKTTKVKDDAPSGRSSTGTGRSSRRKKEPEPVQDVSMEDEMSELSALESDDE